MKIFLIGFMGCGKSTLGKMLARELRCPFVDMDRQLAMRHNMSVNEIFSQYGEAYFRKSEQEFLGEISENRVPMEVVATGGGVACNEDSMRLMKASGIVVYLKRGREELLRRLIAGQHSRPLILGKSPKQIEEFIDKTLAEREQYYMQANITVDCDYMGDSSVVNVIKLALDYELRQ